MDTFKAKSIIATRYQILRKIRTLFLKIDKMNNKHPITGTYINEFNQATLDNDYEQAKIFFDKLEKEWLHSYYSRV